MDYYEARGVVIEAMSIFKQATLGQRDAHHRLNKGGNLITPNVMGFISLHDGKYVAELSFGSGIDQGTYLFGVTIIEQEGNKWVRNTNLSKACNSTNLKSYLLQLDLDEDDRNT